MQTYLKAQRERDGQFPKGLFCDPAWDILVNLYVAKSERRAVLLTDIGQSAGIRQASGLRWLKLLESSRLIERQMDSDDSETGPIALTPNAIAGMNRWLDRICPLQAGNADAN